MQAQTRAAPGDRAACFSPSQACHILSRKGEIKSTLCPKKRRQGAGRGGCAYLLSCSVIYQSALPEAGARAPDLTVARTPPLPFCLLPAAGGPARCRGSCRSQRARTEIRVSRVWSGIAFVQGVPLWMILGTGHMMCFHPNTYSEASSVSG